MYTGVPRTVIVSTTAGPTASSRIFETPKSAIFTAVTTMPVIARRTLALFRSRWSTPSPCMYASPEVICSAIQSDLPLVSCERAGPIARRSRSEPPSTSSITMRTDWPASA
eukprot:Amastigsp_a345783_4.p4 type:complete len:111 gc:universal Amastigsp_a345783_4:464-132(-)